jgi:hypothetical protein
MSKNNIYEWAKSSINLITNQVSTVIQRLSGFWRFKTEKGSLYSPEASIKPLKPVT